MDGPLLKFKFDVAINVFFTDTSLSLPLFSLLLLELVISFKYKLLAYPTVPSLNLTLYQPELATPNISTVSFLAMYPIFLYFVEAPLLTFNLAIAISFLLFVDKF